MKSHLRERPSHAPTPRRLTLALLFSRFYFLQVSLIALAVIMGITFSGLIIKNLLIKTAMEQETAHYWQRYDRDPRVELPDTKNLYGYRWRDQPPDALRGLQLAPGVHRLFIDGHERVTAYSEKGGYRLLLVFGESNVDRLIWLFGLAPLMASLILLYSILWWINRQARRHYSPVAQLAQSLLDIDLSQPRLNRQPFAHIDTSGNTEAEGLKQALDIYHQTLIEYIEREQQFTAEVSHELRTPLAVIKGSLELLQFKHPQDPSLERMQHVIRDMQLLMDTLLTLGRQGSAPLPMSRLDLSRQIQRTCEDLGEIFRQRGMTWDLRVIHDNHCVSNPTLVSMIFSNLIRNALNYSQGQRVGIIIDAARIIIEDDGIGLSDEARATLLRNDGGSHVSHKGFGIGLKLVRRLCGMIGWRIELMSKASLAPLALGLGSDTGLAVVIYTAAGHDIGRLTAEPPA